MSNHAKQTQGMSLTECTDLRKNISVKYRAAIIASLHAALCIASITINAANAHVACRCELFPSWQRWTYDRSAWRSCAKTSPRSRRWIWSRRSSCVCIKCSCQWSRDPALRRTWCPWRLRSSPGQQSCKRWLRLVRAEYWRGQLIEIDSSLSGAVKNIKRSNVCLENTTAYHVDVRS